MTVEDGRLIGKRYVELLTTQGYGRKGQIDGVKLIELPVFSDEGGDFTEIARFMAGGAVESLPDYRPAQISYSFMESGTIKAWHLHRRQDDLWFVPPGDRLLVGLLDTREESPTLDQQRRLVMGAGKGRLLYIPRGVAHGVANISSRGAGIIYFANEAFNPESPDEHRLPWDLLGKEFWTVLPG